MPECVTVTVEHCNEPTDGIGAGKTIQVAGSVHLLIHSPILKSMYPSPPDITSMEDDVAGSAALPAPPAIVKIQVKIGYKRLIRSVVNHLIEALYYLPPPLATDPVLLPGRLLTGDADEVGFRARPP